MLGSGNRRAQIQHRREGTGRSATPRQLFESGGRSAWTPASDGRKDQDGFEDVDSFFDVGASDGGKGTAAGSTAGNRPFEQRPLSDYEQAFGYRTSSVNDDGNDATDYDDHGAGGYDDYDGGGLDVEENNDRISSQTSNTQAKKKGGRPASRRNRTKQPITTSQSSSTGYTVHGKKIGRPTREEKERRRREELEAIEARKQAAIRAEQRRYDPPAFISLLSPPIIRKRSQGDEDDDEEPTSSAAASNTDQNQEIIGLQGTVTDTNEEAPGLRRSRRRKWAPLETWRSERIKYVGTPGGGVEAVKVEVLGLLTPEMAPKPGRGRKKLTSEERERARLVREGLSAEKIIAREARNRERSRSRERERSRSYDNGHSQRNRERSQRDPDRYYSRHRSYSISSTDSYDDRYEDDSIDRIRRLRDRILRYEDRYHELRRRERGRYSDNRNRDSDYGRGRGERRVAYEDERRSRSRDLPSQYDSEHVRSPIRSQSGYNQNNSQYSTGSNANGGGSASNAPNSAGKGRPPTSLKAVENALRGILNHEEQLAELPAVKTLIDKAAFVAAEGTIRQSHLPASFLPKKLSESTSNYLVVKAPGGEELQVPVVRRRAKLTLQPLQYDPTEEYTDIAQAGASFDAPEFTSGVVLVPPRAVKARESSMSTTQIFSISMAQPKSVEVNIGDHTFILGPGDQFFVPQQCKYRIVNHSFQTNAEISFVLIKSSAASSSIPNDK